MLVSGPLTGAVILRYGAVRLLHMALAVIAFGLVLATIGPAWAPGASALVCRVGHGPLTQAGSQVLHTRASARRRSLAFGIKQTGVPAGAAIIGVAAPVLAVVVGWRGAILAVALCRLLVATGLQPLRRGMDAEADPTRPISWRGALGRLRLFHEHARCGGRVPSRGVGAPESPGRSAPLTRWLRYALRPMPLIHHHPGRDLPKAP